MARIFKVQINIDEMNSQLLGLSLEEYGKWLTGFQLGACDKPCNKSDDTILVGYKAGCDARACAVTFSEQQRKRVEKRYSTGVVPGNYRGSTVVVPVDLPNNLPDAYYPVTSNEKLETNKPEPKDTVAIAPVQELLPCVKTSPVAEPDELWDLFWDAYGKKSGKQAAMKVWSKLSHGDRQAAYDGVAGYLVLAPDAKYRKDPERYLKHRVWEDEAVSDAGKVPDPFPLPSPERARYALGLTDIEPDDGWKGGK